MERHAALFLSAMLLAAGGPAGCSDDDTCSEGETESGGPGCCSGGCGSSTSSWLPRICKNSQWVCEAGGTIEDACASKENACEPQVACTQTVGIGGEELDPAPELCCESSCKGTKALHRICVDGLKFQCPSNAAPISRCEDYMAACGGILQRYRDNSYKLPAQ